MKIVRIELIQLPNLSKKLIVPLTPVEHVSAVPGIRGTSIKVARSALPKFHFKTAALTNIETD